MAGQSPQVQSAQNSTQPLERIDKHVDHTMGYRLFLDKWSSISAVSRRSPSWAGRAPEDGTPHM